MKYKEYMGIFEDGADVNIDTFWPELNRNRIFYTKKLSPKISIVKISETSGSQIV